MVNFRLVSIYRTSFTMIKCLLNCDVLQYGTGVRYRYIIIQGLKDSCPAVGSFRYIYIIEIILLYMDQ